MPRLQKHAEAIMELFREYDADDDGKLSKEEVEKMIENEILDDDIKAKIKKAGIEKIMGRMDKNGDGAIDQDEFHKLFRVVMKRCYHKKTGKGKGCEDCTED